MQAMTEQDWLRKKELQEFSKARSYPAILFFQVQSFGC